MWALGLAPPAISVAACWLPMTVQHRISGFPVVDDNWKLVVFS